MTPHTHREYVEGCYRCELGRDEVAQAEREASGVEPMTTPREVIADGAQWDVVQADGSVVARYTVTNPSVFTEAGLITVRQRWDEIRPTQSPHRIVRVLPVSDQPRGDTNP